MIEVGEQPWQISTQGKVGTPESIMGEPPPHLPVHGLRTLLQELTPLLVPLIE